MAKTNTAETTKPAAKTSDFEMVSKENLEGDRYAVVFKKGETEFRYNVRLGSLRAEISTLTALAEKQDGEEKTRTEEVLASKVWLATQLET